MVKFTNMAYTACKHHVIEWKTITTVRGLVYFSTLCVFEQLKSITMKKTNLFFNTLILKLLWHIHVFEQLNNDKKIYLNAVYVSITISLISLKIIFSISQVFMAIIFSQLFHRNYIDRFPKFLVWS